MQYHTGTVAVFLPFHPKVDVIPVPFPLWHDRGSISIVITKKKLIAYWYRYRYDKRKFINQPVLDCWHLSSVFQKPANNERIKQTNEISTAKIGY
jgi:hypothetical protein